MNNDQSWNHRPTMKEFLGETSPVVVQTEEELNQAVEKQADTIIIEGDLANNIRIEATGKPSIAVAIGIICVNIAKFILGAKVGSQTSFTSSTKGKYLVENSNGRSIVLKRQ